MPMKRSPFCVMMIRTSRMKELVMGVADAVQTKSKMRASTEVEDSDVDR